jgi:subfamily B ATP-binding cassette protein MsbA
VGKIPSNSPEDNKPSGLSIYLRLLKYLVNYKSYIALAAVGLTIVALANLVFTALLTPLLDDAFKEDAGNITVLIPIVIAIIFTFRSFGSFLGAYYLGSVGQRIVKELRSEMHEKLLYSPAGFYDASAPGSLLSKFSFDVERVARAATKSLPILIRDSLTVITLLGLMIYISWKLTVILFIASPLVYIVVSIATRRFKRLSHRIQASIGGITERVEEAVSGHFVVKLFTAEDREIGEFEAINEKNRRNQTKFIAVKAVNTPLVQLILGLAFAIVIYVAFLPDVKQDLTPGQFASFVTAVMGMLNAARKLTTVNEILQAGIAASESVFKLIDQEVQRDHGSIVIEHAQGDVEFKNVCFTYESKQTHALHDINLHIRQGEFVALVGRSGSGKSTLVKLIPRFYEINSGDILIDGHSIHDIKLKNLRSQIAKVSQDILLFNDTVENNISYAMPDKSSKDIQQAAKLAHAAEFIDKLPDKYQSVVGDKGVLLSGGQKQRIAIARALLKDAPILIFDEATSALDSESEKHIQSALKELRGTRTTIVIAHRLSTIEGADRIYVMDEGQIVEHGTHEELIKLGGAYTRLYQHQFKDV